MTTSSASPLVGTKPTLWKNQNFVGLFSSTLLVGFAFQVTNIGLPLVAYDLTHSAVDMGIVRALQFLPSVLFALIIGALVDRLPKKAPMLISVFGQAGTLLVLFLLLSQPHAHFGLPEYATVTAFFLFNYWYVTAQTVSIRYSLPKALLMEANSRIAAVGRFYGLIAPLITGFLLTLTRTEFAILLPAVLLVLANAFLLRFQLEEEPRPAATGFWKFLREAWQALSANTALFHLTAIVAVANALDGVFGLQIIFHVRDTLKLSDAAAGAFVASAGVAGLAGSIATPRLRAWFGVGNLLILSIFTAALAYALACVPNAIFLLLAAVLDGFGFTVFVVCVWGFRQETTPAELMGRIAGITGSAFKILLPAALYGAGLMTEAFGVTIVFGCCSLIAAFVGVLMCLDPYLRNRK
jgi:MFS family permease